MVRLAHLCCDVIVARCDARSLTSATLAALPEACAEQIFLAFVSALRLTPSLAKAFAESGHERLTLAVGSLDLARGVVGGYPTSCRE